MHKVHCGVEFLIIRSLAPSMSDLGAYPHLTREDLQSPTSLEKTHLCSSVGHSNLSGTPGKRQPLCQNYPSDPITIRYGHNFCCYCIQQSGSIYSTCSLALPPMLTVLRVAPKQHSAGRIMEISRLLTTPEVTGRGMKKHAYVEMQSSPLGGPRGVCPLALSALNTRATT